MITGQTPSDTALTTSQEARQVQFAHPRLLTDSEVELMLQDFNEANEWAIEELRKNSWTPCKAPSQNT